MSEIYRRLPLDGLKNARELGGFPTKYGTATKFGRFVRSEVPKQLTERDMDFLKNYGVRTSIDFRGDLELGYIPSVLRNVDFAEYYHCPTFNSQVAFPKGKPESMQIDIFVKWSEKYCEMLTMCADWVRKTLEIMENAEGCILYHCTTGKDRTGIISALLLSIAGVDEEDIIADYSVSQIHLKTVYLSLQKTLPGEEDTDSVDLNAPFYKTEASTMEYMLNFLNTKFGSPEEYLKAIGVSEKTIKALKAKLTE